VNKVKEKSGIFPSFESLFSDKEAIGRGIDESSFTLFGFGPILDDKDEFEVSGLLDGRSFVFREASSLFVFKTVVPIDSSCEEELDRLPNFDGVTILLLLVLLSFCLFFSSAFAPDRFLSIGTLFP